MIRRILAVATAAVVLISACSRDGGGPSSPPGFVDRSQVISDGAHGGNAHFFFLPPVAANPTTSGAPDGTLSPRVGVCEWNVATQQCGAVIASFTTSSGTGAEQVSYDAAGGFYKVNWKTNVCVTGPCTLNPDTPYRLRVFVGSAELGFIDVTVVPNASALKNLNTGETIGLVEGKTLPVKFRIEEGAVSVVAPGQSASIGSNGGTVTTADGAVAIAFSTGALTESTPISVTPVANPAEGAESWAPVLELGPDGTAFSAPVTLTMSYDPAALPEGVTPENLTIYTLVDGAWELVGETTLNEADHTISVPLAHFSQYRVGVTARVGTFATATTIGVGDATRLTATACRVITFGCLPAANVRIRWYAGGGFGALSFPATTVTATNGTSVNDFVGTNPGTISVVALVEQPGSGSSMGSIWITINPRLSIRWGGLSDAGPNGTGTVSESSSRTVGVGRTFGLRAHIASAATAPVNVIVTHINPARGNGTPTATIPAGATFSSGVVVNGLAAGRDTIIVSAYGWGRDTLYLDVGTGSFHVQNWPSQVELGDSVRVRVWLESPGGGTLESSSGPMTIIAVGSTNLQLGDDGPVGNPRCSGRTCLFPSFDSPIVVTGYFWIKPTAPGIATLTVTGENSAPRVVTLNVPAPPLPPNAPILAAGGKSNCALRLDKTGLCWGEASYDATAIPSGTFTTIGGGFFHYCAMRPDQSLTCWGNNSNLVAQPPAGAFSQLIVGPEANCALRLDSTPVCWGFSGDGRISPPGGQYKQISLGWYHGCGIRPDDTVTCWGQNGSGQATPPAGTFKSISGGTGWTCGIRMNNAIECWGAIAAPPSGTFRQVASASAGGHACAIRTDNTLACWGENIFGQASPPTGQFVQVVTNYQHSCGVRSDLAVLCWGSNHTGALDVPSFDPSPWSLAASMPTPRWGSATVSAGGKIYVIGGNASPQEPYPGGPLVATVEIYDPASNTWTNGAPLPVPLEHMMAAEYQGRIFVFGGWMCNLCGDNRIWAYDIGGNTWGQVSTLPIFLNGGVAGVFNGRIYMTTGSCCGSPAQGFAVFDPATQQFNTMSRSPRRHDFAAGGGIINGKFYVAGGEGAGGALDVYDFSTDTWSTGAAMPVNRQHGAGVVMNNKLYIFGGENDGPGSNRDVLVYDPASDSWSVVTQMISGRNLNGAALVNGSVYVVGGNTGTSPGAPIGRVDRYRP